MVGDLADANFVSGIPIQPFCIVHLAANLGRQMDDNLSLHRDNVLSTVHLLELAKSRGCRKIIYASSVSVYGDCTTSPLGRTSAAQARSPYGRSKLVAEQHLMNTGSGIARLALRLPGVLGPSAQEHLISGLVRKAIQGDQISFWNGDHLFNNVVDVTDLSRFIAKLAIDTHDLTFDAFPLAARDPIPMREVVELIKLRVKSNSLVTEISSNNSSFFIDDRYARSVLGYESMTTRSAITHFVDSHARVSSYGD